MAAKARDKRTSAKKSSAKKRPARKPASGKRRAAKKASPKKKAAKRKPARKKTVRKGTAKAKKKAAKKPAKRAAKKTAKRTAKKPTKRAAKKRAKKTPKRTAKAPAKKRTTAPRKKSKFAITGAPKARRREVPPGVRIEKPQGQAASGARAEAPPPKLTAKELRELRGQLQEKRDNILSEIRHEVGDSLSRTSVVRTDAADRASDVYDGSVSYEVAATGHKDLQEIQAALDKIDNKTYGVCEGCGGAISASRLKAKPFATLCAACREQIEREGPGGGGDTIWGFLDADATDNAEE